MLVSIFVADLEDFCCRLGNCPMRALIGIVLTFWLTLLAGQPALADKRVALVIGNSAYRNVAKLSNPANDAAAVAAMFKSAGFDPVESKLNLTVSELRKTLRDFGNASRDADVAVVYYAGHGIELDGTNYLIPVDATLETDADVLDETLSLDRVLFAVEPAKQLRLVILDACRDNPFAKNMKRTIASRAIGRGLAKVEPSSPNTMIAFAAKAGSTASDGDGKNSPFATALVNHLAEPGLDLRKAFGFVRDDVLKATNNAQEPFIYGSLGGNDVTLVPATPVVSVPVDQDATMRRDYEFADRVGTKPVWDAFIEKYPSGFYTALAKAQRDKLAAEAARIEATNKAKAAEEEQRRLAVEGAKAAELAKAVEQAKAAEKARIAAELAKKAEEAKVAEAERAKAGAIAKAAEDARAAEAVKAAAEAKAAAEKKASEEKLAALTPPAEQSDQPNAVDLPRALQAELRRVGCNTGAIDGNWNAASQRSLDLFNKHAGMKLDVKIASADALDTVKEKTSRVCPLVCDHGFRADGDRCMRITCRAGYQIGDDNSCEKMEVKKPTAKREEPKNNGPQRAKVETTPAKPQAVGQIFCGRGGCRPVQEGCHLGTPHQTTNSQPGGIIEVCK
jgi:Caspase domain